MIAPANRKWSFFTLALLSAAAVLRCGPLLGLDGLELVSCTTNCDAPVDASAADANAGGTGGSSATVAGSSATGSGSTGSTSTGSNAGSSSTGGGTGSSSSTVTGSSSTGATGTAATSGATGSGGAAGTTSGGATGTAGGAGGAPGSGGGGGVGGSTGRVDAGADGPVVGEELIDNLEDNRVPHLILQSQGRYGYWFTVNDGTLGGVQSPPADAFRASAGGANGSAFAAHLSGLGFTTWGIYAGFTLNKTPQGRKNPYDMRAYKGVSFWAKLGPADMCAPASQCHILRFNISTNDTDPAGGVCTLCEDHFGSWQTLTSRWQKYTVLFDDLAQEGWGAPGPSSGLKFDPSRAYEMKFLVKPAGKPFDFWIDDVSFVLR